MRALLIAEFRLSKRYEKYVSNFEGGGETATVHFNLKKTRTLLADSESISSFDAQL
jgi:hypothetical protein